MKYLNDAWISPCQKQPFRHQILLFGAALTISQTASAQSNVGASAIGNATSQLNGYDIAVKKLLYAIAAIISLVGAFNVYFKMQNGDQDVKKTIMMTLGGCVAFCCFSTSITTILFITCHHLKVSLYSRGCKSPLNFSV